MTEERTEVPVHEVSVEEARLPEARAIIPGIGNVTSTFAIVGKSDFNDRLYDLVGLHLSTPVPAAVMVQPRQSDNRDFGWHDEFAVQVITTSTSAIRVRVRRLDQNSGWGQYLRLDLLIFDQVNNP